MKISTKTSITKTFLLTFLLIISDNSAFAQLFWNQAATFAGSNSSYIAVRHAAELSFTGSFTLEAWVKPTNSISPPFQIIMQKRDAGNDGYTLYLNNGKVSIRTDATTRLSGSAVIPSNVWTHIAGTFNSATNTFSTYVNGFLDSSVVVAGAAPTANTDSLWIGKGFNSPFAGQMDEVRIWNVAQTFLEINSYRRTSLASGTGAYANCKMSLTFQDNDGSGPPFILNDFSNNQNPGVNRGVTTFDMSNRPLQSLQTNDCIELDGALDYLAAADNATVSPTTQLTLSAWIYPRAYANSIIIHKGPSSGGAGTNYRLSMVNRKLAGAINGSFNFNSDDTIKLHQWSYVCFTYYALLGSYQFHINGELVFAGINNVGNIVDGTDSLYIGGASGLVNFDGYIDEARIIPDVKFTQTLNQFMFKSIDVANGGSSNYTVYNFDGYAYPNGGTITPLLRFVGDAFFAHCGSINNQPQSPLNRADAQNFEDGFLLKTSGNRIPAAGFSGNMQTETLKVIRNLTISDLNVFIGLNHNQEQDLEIYLFGPNGDNVQLYNQNSLVADADHVVTIFDDQADSSMVNNRYVNYSPKVKPFSNLNAVFSGDNSLGNWRLIIRDVTNSVSSDTGMLYGWGIQFNNEATKPFQLNVKNYVQGLYDSGTNSMIPDTMRYYLRNVEDPTLIYDSVKVLLNSSGAASLFFPTNTFGGVAYYLQCKHRNALQTWNNEAVYYDPLTYQAEYNFTNEIAKAYGSNMIQVDTAPVSWAFYSGDVDGDDNIDATDLINIYNHMIVGTSGYVRTDLNGDDFVDVTDLVMAYNNQGLSAVTPLPAPLKRTESVQTDIQQSFFSDPAMSDGKVQSGHKREITFEK